MIKSVLRYFLRDELHAIRLEALDAQDRLHKSLVLSFKTVNERIQLVEKLALDTSDAVGRVNNVLNDELDLLSGAHEHLDDIVTGIIEEIAKDHNMLGLMFDEVLGHLDELDERVEELEG